MSILVIRHGISEANNRENKGTPLFGSTEAELMELGKKQARTIPTTLLARYAIKDLTTPVATSRLRRTQQTAHEAGFWVQAQYAALDEIEPSVLGVSRLEVRQMIDTGKLSSLVLEEAAKTLTSLPKETILFTHGLRIAGICAVLGIYQNAPLIPQFCEVRELPIEC